MSNEDFRRRFPGYMSGPEEEAAQVAARRASNAASQATRHQGVLASLEYLARALPILARIAADRAVAVEIQGRFGRMNLVAGWIFGSFDYQTGAGDDYAHLSYHGPYYFAITEDGRIVQGVKVQRGQMAGLSVSRLRGPTTVAELISEAKSRKSGTSGPLWWTLMKTSEIKREIGLNL